MHHMPSPLIFLPLVRSRVEFVVIGFAVVLGMFLISGSNRAFAQGGVWVSKTPMPTARSHVMAAGIEGKLYVVGGQISCCDADMLDVLEVYDPATDAWTMQAPMHQAPSAGGSAGIGGKLYVGGGRIPGIDVATLEVYDPATNTWTTKTPMPTPRRHPAVEAIDGLLYVAGGTQEGPGPGSLSILEVYDPATDTWTTKASLPAPRDSMASGVVDGKLYLAGGETTNNEIVATLLVYDPGTNIWTEKAPMPTARAFPAGAVLNGQLYVVTGIADSVSPPLRTVEVYDPATDTWRTAAPIPTGRDRLGEVGVIDGKLYVAGGWNPCFGCDIATLEVFEPTEDSVAFEDLEAGARLTEVVSREGRGPIRVHGTSPLLSQHINAAAIFDSACPPGGIPEDCTGDDTDLGTPNEAFGGPGVGSGGTSSNHIALGKVLIIAEHVEDANRDGLIDDPNDSRQGGTLQLDFSALGTVTMHAITFLDLDRPDPAQKVEFFHGGTTGTLLATVALPFAGENGVSVVPLQVPGVDTMVITLTDSAAIDNIAFTLESDVSGRRRVGH